MIYIGRLDTSLWMLPMYKAVNPKQIKIIPTKNKIITAKMAEPEKCMLKGLFKIYFSINMNKPKRPEKKVVIIPKYPVTRKGNKL